MDKSDCQSRRLGRTAGDADSVVVAGVGRSSGDAAPWLVGSGTGDACRRAVFVIVALVALLLGAARDVRAQEAEATDALRAPADWAQCWTERGQLPPSHIDAAERLMAPASLSTGLALRTPAYLARPTLTQINRTRHSTASLLRYEIPLWRVEPLTAHLEPGRPLSLTHGLNACLPYPIRAMAASPQPLTRGRTLALMLETDGMAFCRVTYLGRTEQCYRDGLGRLYALIGISALAEPAMYTVNVDLMSGGASTTFAFPLEVGPGTYGFQFIEPPAELSQLMDPDVMGAEEAHLETWRALRSYDRQWDFPLMLPLERSVPISADFGDRRSYGGVVDGYHSGVDYRAPKGMSVLAPADGVVVKAGALTVRGNVLLIDHGWGLTTGYWHLSRMHVEVGDRISRGQVIAEVGSTGLSTGPHLHWEVWVNGISINGQQWLELDGFEGVPFDRLTIVDEEGAQD